MTIEMLGKHELGAYAISTGNQYRLTVASGRKGEHTAESAETGQDFRALRSLDPRCNAFDKFVAGVDVDPGLSSRDSWFAGSGNKRGVLF